MVSLVMAGFLLSFPYFLPTVSSGHTPLVLTTSGKLSPSANDVLQSLADVPSSTGVVDRGLWLNIAKEHLSRVQVRGCGTVLQHDHQNVAKSAGKQLLVGVPVECIWMFFGFLARFIFRGCGTPWSPLTYRLWLKTT